MAEEDFTKEGDNVILYEGLDKMQALKLKHGEIHQNRFGAFYHDDIIGKLWGSKIVARKSRGFTYVLRPIPELWAICCFHRTQILFSTDISAICLGLDLNPGRVVVEAGTGSGVLSHAMARCVAPTGHLFTFEFHRKRAEAAAQDFLDHGFSPFITVTHRDVGMEGFKKPRAGNPMIVKAPVTATSLPPPFCPLAAPGTSRMPPDEQEDAFADGVFLDLPNPHDAMPHAWRALKAGGRLCSFSPCIEQVQRACRAMANCGFVEIRTIEGLIRPFEIRRAPADSDQWFTGPFPTKQSRPRTTAAAGASEGPAEAAAGAAPATTAPAEDDDAMVPEEDEPSSDEAPEDQPAEGRGKKGGARAQKQKQPRAGAEEKADKERVIGNKHARGAESMLTAVVDGKAEPVLRTIPTAAIRTHTGYLTFCRKPPPTAGGRPAPDPVPQPPAATLRLRLPAPAPLVAPSPHLTPIALSMTEKPAGDVVSLMRPHPLSTDAPAAATGVSPVALMRTRSAQQLAEKAYASRSPVVGPHPGPPPPPPPPPPMSK